MKINFKARPPIDYSLKEPGNWIISCVSGKTRTQGELYRVIASPKLQAIDPDFMWYLSQKGHPVKIGNAKINTFKLASKEEIEKHLNGEIDEDKI